MSSIRERKIVEGESRKLNAFPKVGKIFLRPITLKVISGPRPALTKAEYEGSPSELPDSSSCCRMGQELNEIVKLMRRGHLCLNSCHHTPEQSSFGGVT